ncbi:MAG TPA: hypothetical protein EYH17_01710 [Pyrodictium sp.]|nr:hypothetical protein [Pyrodictium sp.]
MNNLRKMLDRKPLLQVALDVVRLEDALRIASQLRELNNVYVEAGTPLIKSEGLRVVRLIKAVTETPVVADTKTADTALLEARLATQAGADAYTVLATAPKETLLEAKKAAEEYDILLMVDLIHSTNPLEDSRRAAEHGADIIIVHVGIDVQQRLGLTADRLAELVSKIKSTTRKLVAVAGGIKPEGIPHLVKAGADILIVGGYITKSKNPRQAALECLEAMQSSQGMD